MANNAASSRRNLRNWLRNWPRNCGTGRGTSHGTAGLGSWLNAELRAELPLAAPLRCRPALPARAFNPAPGLDCHCLPLGRLRFGYGRLYSECRALHGNRGCKLEQIRGLRDKPVKSRDHAVNVLIRRCIPWARVFKISWVGPPCSV